MTNTIDLRDYVGKKVQVRYKNGQIKEGVVSESSDYKELYNYYFNGVAYTSCGSTYGVLAKDGYRIVNVESTEEADKYKRLVEEVSALRKEVEALKEERSASESASVSTPGITLGLQPMRVTRSFVVKPEEYLEYCKCFGEDPSKNGFVHFLTQEMDYLFREEGSYEETIEEVGQ